MAGTEDVAFFRFGNNAQENASQITAAMEQIRSALSQQLPTPGQNKLNAGGFAPVFDDVEKQVNEGRARIERAVRQIQEGSLKGLAGRRELESAVRDTLSGLPQVIANALQAVPEAARLGTNPAEIGRQYVRSIREGLVSELNALTQAGGPLANFSPFSADRFNGTVRQLERQPIAPLPVSAIDQLRQQAFAERIVVRDPVGTSKAQQDLERALGLEAAAAQVRAERLRVPESGDAFIEDPRRDQNRLRELEARTRTDETIARNERTAEIRRATAVEREARQRLERSNLERINAANPSQVFSQGNVRGLNGRFFRLTDTLDGPGAREIKNRQIIVSLLEAEAKRRKQLEDSAQRQADSTAQLAEQSRNGRLLDGAGDRVGRAGLPSNIRELDGAYFRATAAGFQRITNERQILELMERQARALQQQSTQETRGRSGLLGGFLGRFQRGDQTFLTGLGGQIASAAAFSAAYGAIFGLQAVMRDTLNEFLDYQDSLTDLEVATRSADVVTSDWVNTLSDLAIVSGSNVGEALDTAARGVRAFTDATSTAQEVQSAGTETADTASKLALIAGKDLKDATGDTIAIGSAFGLEPDQLNQIVDAVANAKRNVGGDASQISQGLALISLSAQEAGFNLNEAAAVIGLVQARTDQSGQAIATRLTRVFQIIQGSTGKRLGNQLGVDTNQTVKDQLLDYAQIFSDENTSEPTRDRISSALGGTANLRELLPLLTESDTLITAFEEAASNAGQGTEEFNRKTENLVGTLKKIKGEISSIQVGLANSGVFDIVGAAFLTIEPALYAVDQLLKGYNGLIETVPGLRQLSGVLIDILLVSKAIAVIQGTNIALGFGGAAAAGAGGTAAAVGGATTAQVIADRARRAGNRFVGSAGAAVAAGGLTGALNGLVPGARRAAQEQAEAAARQREIAVITALTQQRLIAEGRFNQAILLSSAQRAAAERVGSTAAVAGAPGTLAAGAGTLGKFLINPVTIGIVAAITTAALVGNELQNAKKLDQAQGVANDAARALERNDTQTARGLLAAAESYRAAAQEVSKIDVGFLRGGEKDDIVSDLQDDQLALARLASRVSREEFEARASSGDLVGALGTGAITSVEQLADGLQDLADAGFSAYTQALKLNDALQTAPLDDGSIRFGLESITAGVTTSANQNLARFIPFDSALITDEELEQGSYIGESGQSRLRDSSGRFTGKPVDVGGADFFFNDVNGRSGGNGSFDPDFEEFALGANILGQQDAIREAIFTKANQLGLSQGDIITSDQVRELSLAGTSAIDFGDLRFDADQQDIVRRALGGFISKGIAGFTEGSALGLLNGGGSLSSQNVLDILNPADDGGDGQAYAGLLTVQQAGLENLPASDDGRLLRKQLKSNLGALRSLRDRAGDQAPEVLLDAIANAEFSLVQSRFEDLEKLREAALSRGDLTKGQETKLAIKSAQAADGQVVILEQLLATLNEDVAEEIRKTFVQARNIARAALIARQEQIDYINSLGPQELRILGLESSILSTEDAQAALDAAQGDLDAFDRARDRTSFADGGGGEALTAEQRAALAAGSGLDSDQTVAIAANALRQARADLAAIEDKGSREYYDALKAVQEAEDGLASAILERASSARAVTVARSGGSALAAATAALQDARAELRDAIPGTVRYNNALAALYNAQFQMAQAQRDYTATRLALAGDITDPLEEARIALQIARKKLRDDRRLGAGKDVIAEDRLSLEQAEAQLQQTAFQQRLSDIQTAEQLGRISFATYIRYLEREHDRLEKIKNRTRQQQDQLNTIDQAIQEANNAADAQFNFGAINTRGLVYQARRYAAEQRAQRAASEASAQARSVSPVYQQDVRIEIDGADIQKVRQVLNDILGQGGRTRTAAPRRR